ncbi:hypothetical protein A2U01_0067545, partial [Trifolium medium]|nr:hypothetical protein [Trifolium medium]
QTCARRSKQKNPALAKSSSALGAATPARGTDNRKTQDNRTTALCAAQHRLRAAHMPEHVGNCNFHAKA